MRRLLAAIMVVTLVAGALVLTGASEGTASKGTKYKIEFDNAFGLTEGGDLKVGGVRAGSTEKFSVRKKDGRFVAVVDATVTEPGFDSFRKDASCDIRPQSLIGEYYVSCQPGVSDEKLPAGGTVPVEQNTSTVPPDLMQNVMRRPYRERFRLILAELGTGLAGRPQDIDEVLRRAHPGLRETSEVLEILGDQSKIIQDFITDSDTVVAELEDKKKEVARWIREAGRTAEVSATRREALAEGWRTLPVFLGELEPTMARLGEVADEQTPLMRDLRQVAPDLDKFFTELGPFSESSRPAIDSLGEMGKVGIAAIKESKEEVAELRKLAADAPEAGKPLRQFLQAFDDRRYSSEPDPRAEETAPPAPDPTSGNPKDGFTVFESILNYAYWQTLAINGYDDVGHYLRALLIETCGSAWHPGPADSDPSNDKDEQHTFEKCVSWTGPFQPGVNAPDPTDDAGQATMARRARELAADPKQKRRPGDPEAPPVPGKPDLSKPRVVLPEPVRKLLEDLPNLDKAVENAIPQIQAQGQEPSADALLNFLLAP